MTARRRDSYLLIINDFLHDLFTGLWLSAFFVLILMERRGKGYSGTEVGRIIQGVLQELFWLGIASLTLVVITGIVRISHYQADTGAKKGLLRIKHIILSLIIIFATYFQYRMAFP